MRKYFLLMTIAAMMLASIGCSLIQGPIKETSSVPLYGTLEIGVVSTLDQLISDSGLIVEVRKTGKVEEIVDQNVELTLTEVKVNHVILGDASLSDHNIRILDLKSLSMGLHDKESHYLLFLHPKTGRLGDDIYSVVGVYQGKFKINKKNQLYYDADQYGGIKTFQDDISKLSLAESIDAIHTKVEQNKRKEIEY